MLDAAEQDAARLVAEIADDLNTGRIDPDTARATMREMRDIFGERMEAIKFAVAASASRA